MCGVSPITFTAHNLAQDHTILLLFQESFGLLIVFAVNIVTTPTQPKVTLTTRQMAHSGYFPSYTLGAMYASLLMAAIKKMVDVDGAIQSGGFKPYLHLAVR